MRAKQCAWSWKTLEIRIQWQPKQRLAWNIVDGPTVTRFGIGGARGGTKSGFLRRALIARRWKYPRTTGLLLRRTLPELESSHLLKLFEEFPELRPYYHDQKKMLRLPNGSIQFFASAQTPKDVAKFYSAEFADIGIDEAQEFSQDEMERLSGSNRCTSNLDILPKMIFSFMPGLSESGTPPVGLPYLKRVFVDHDIRGDEGRETWDFLQAFAWDNIEWARLPLNADGISDSEFYGWPEETRKQYFLERTAFGAKLSALTNKELKNAWLFGDWKTFQGQYFDNWNYEKHTLPAEEIQKCVKPWSPQWISGDWGYDHPACIHLHAMDEHEHVYTIKEIWGREIGETQLGHLIGEMCAGLKISAFVFSWDAFGKLSRTTQKSITETIGDALPRNLPHPSPADASPGSRISGWRLMHQLIDANMWTVSRECTKLIECLPTLLRDMERNSEDVLKVDYSENYVGDDPADSARYGLQYMCRAPSVPVEVRAAQKVEKITDPSMRHLALDKFYADEAKKNQPVPLARRHPRRKFGF